MSFKNVKIRLIVGKTNPRTTKTSERRYGYDNHYFSLKQQCFENNNILSSSVHARCVDDHIVYTTR